MSLAINTGTCVPINPGFPSSASHGAPKFRVNLSVEADLARDPSSSDILGQRTRVIPAVFHVGLTVSDWDGPVASARPWLASKTRTTEGRAPVCGSARGWTRRSGGGPVLPLPPLRGVRPRAAATMRLCRHRSLAPRPPPQARVAGAWATAGRTRRHRGYRRCWRPPVPLWGRGSRRLLRVLLSEWPCEKNRPVYPGYCGREIPGATTLAHDSETRSKYRPARDTPRSRVRRNPLEHLPLHEIHRIAIRSQEAALKN